MKVYHPKPEERATFKKLAQPGVLDWMRKNPKIDTKWVDALLAAVDKAEKKLGMK
ncbi:MAG: hypothetical protein ACETWT_08440 [Thermodesulfobacteriota bacterium]